MLISGTGITPFTQLVKPDFKSVTLPALEWVEVSDGNYKAVDRGASQDVYQASFRIYKTEAAVNTFIDEIEANRIAGSNEITLSTFASTEHIFGADVDYSGNITATVLEIKDRKQSSWKGFSVQVKVQAISPSFTGSATFPDLEYLEVGYVGDSSVPINKMDTYDGTFAYADRDAGAGMFTGTFTLSDTNMKNLRRYLASQRGAAFNLTGINGVTYPFGIRRSSGYPYSVKCVDWEDLGMRDVHNWRVKLVLAEVV
jgi:hypothetical protein